MRFRAGIQTHGTGASKVTFQFTGATLRIMHGWTTVVQLQSFASELATHVAIRYGVNTARCACSVPVAAQSSIAFIVLGATKTYR